MPRTKRKETINGVVIFFFFFFPRVVWWFITGHLKATNFRFTWREKINLSRNFPTFPLFDEEYEAFLSAIDVCQSQCLGRDCMILVAWPALSLESIWWVPDGSDCSTEQRDQSRFQVGGICWAEPLDGWDSPVKRSSMPSSSNRVGEKHFQSLSSKESAHKNRVMRIHSCFTLESCWTRSNWMFPSLVVSSCPGKAMTWMSSPGGVRKDSDWPRTRRAASALALANSLILENTWGKNVFYIVNEAREITVAAIFRPLKICLIFSWIRSSRVEDWRKVSDILFATWTSVRWNEFGCCIHW